MSVNAQGWHTRRYLENDRFQVRRKYTFERELEGTNSSSERAAIESLGNWGTAEKLAFPCSVSAASIFFTSGSETGISCQDSEGRNIRQRIRQSQVENARPHVSSPSPSNKVHFLKLKLQTIRMAMSQREIHTRTIPAKANQETSRTQLKTTYFRTIFGNGDVV